MPNDAKLGLLAGVAGVVAAAVLYFQPPAPTPPAGTTPPAPTTATAARPANSPAAVARVAVPPLVEPNPLPIPVSGAAVVAGRRSELEAKPTSRPADEDE